MKKKEGATQIHAGRDWFGWRWSWSQVHQFSSFDAMQGGGGGGAPVPASPVPAGGGSRYGPQPDTHAEVVAQSRVCALQGWLSGRLRARGLRCHAARSGTGGVPDMGGWAPGGARAGAKEARYESGAAGASRPPVRAQLSVPRPRNQVAAGRASAGATRGAVADGRRALAAWGQKMPTMDPEPLVQADRARAWWSVPCPRNQSGAPHTCSRTEPCSCSCVRDRCSGRARQDGVKSWPLCANRKPGCRGIAARSVATLERGVHTLLHSTARSRPKA